MLSEMKSYCHVKPGQNGSKRLVEQYGDRLLCVRYPYDEQRRVRVKTVELIVEERPWQPFFKFKDEDLVPVMVGFEEIASMRQALQSSRDMRSAREGVESQIRKSQGNGVGNKDSRRIYQSWQETVNYAYK